MTPTLATACASPWPYPRWIAHRGAGKLAPENTLAAFRQGAQYGFRMFECDAKLSADGVVFLLHDATLQRTTNAAKILLAHAESAQSAPKSVASETHLIAGNQPWSVLSQLDAGSWHSRTFAGESLPTLEAIAAYCLRNGFFLNIEIKPTPGTERHTGEVVARAAARLWANQAVPPLLTSFAPEALAGAQASAAHLPRGLLLDTLWAGWLDCAQSLGCQAIVCNYALWDPTSVALAHNAGFKTLSYTVNDEWAAQQLIALGTDGIITDRVDLFSPA